MPLHVFTGVSVQPVIDMVVDPISHRGVLFFTHRVEAEMASCINVDAF